MIVNLTVEVIFKTVDHVVFRVKLLFLTIMFEQKMTAIKLLLIDLGVRVR